jgi:hypothetical protein
MARVLLFVVVWTPSTMTFFEDLSPYTYIHPEEELPGTVNIGWLDRGQPFPVGKTSAQFRAKLMDLCRRPVKQTRGFHSCPFCRGRNRPRGSAEIRVRGTGRVYAAPTLVHHYVTVHQYKPPEEFIEAVLQIQGTPG